MTAEQKLKELIDFSLPIDQSVVQMMIPIVMIEFAKYHVEKALEEAQKKATMDLTYPEPYEDSNESGLAHACADEISRGGEYGSVEINTKSILNAYPLTNII